MEQKLSYLSSTNVNPKLPCLLSLLLMLTILASCNNPVTGVNQVNQKMGEGGVTLIAPKTGSVQSASLVFLWKASKKVVPFILSYRVQKTFRQQ